jgi:AcrR family transcriptional regulator
MSERIVDVALELFARQGYGGTSLRHIAERLGVSKAAVYYHFRTKDEIARVLADRALDTLEAMTDRLIVAGTDLAAWKRALPQIIDLAIKERELLFMFERNEDAFNLLFASDPILGGRLNGQDVRLAEVFGDPAIDPATRVRLGCAYGAVFGPLLKLANHFQDMPTKDLRKHLRTALGRLIEES